MATNSTSWFDRTSARNMYFDSPQKSRADSTIPIARITCFLPIIDRTRTRVQIALLGRSTIPPSPLAPQAASSPRGDTRATLSRYSGAPQRVRRICKEEYQRNSWIGSGSLMENSARVGPRINYPANGALNELGGIVPAWINSIGDGS